MTERLCKGLDNIKELQLLLLFITILKVVTIEKKGLKQFSKYF